MHPTSTPSAHTKKQVALLRKQALAYPEAHEDFPWGHSAFKVKGKAFAFLHADGEGFSISVKLPESNALALHLPFAEPTGYGLGKSGWVTARFTSKQAAPMPVLSAWLDESYRAIAPKRFLQAWLVEARGSARAQSKNAGAAGAASAAPPAKTRERRASKQAPAKRAATPKRGQAKAGAPRSARAR